MKKLSAKEVKEHLDREEPVLLLNVLPEDRFREMHIPGSVNVPLGQERFVQRVRDLTEGKDAEVLVYCADADCDASSKASDQLEGAGFRNVADFEGGIREWKAAGYSVEGEAVGR